MDDHKKVKTTDAMQPMDEGELEQVNVGLGLGFAKPVL